MLYRRKTYRVRPEQVGPFTAFFAEYLLPNQLKHGARLIGRFVTEAQDEIVALWEYVDYAAYQRVQAAVAADPMHERAQAKRRELGPLFIDSREDFLTPTGHYMPPKQVVAVCACVTNADGEVLLVRTDWRSDTWEMPGGQVEENEALHVAVQREVLEETGLEIRVSGVTGVYNNAARGIVTVVFLRGEVTGGGLPLPPAGRHARRIRALRGVQHAALSAAGAALLIQQGVNQPVQLPDSGQPFRKRDFHQMMMPPGFLVGVISLAEHFLQGASIPYRPNRRRTGVEQNRQCDLPGPRILLPLEDEQFVGPLRALNRMDVALLIEAVAPGAVDIEIPMADVVQQPGLAGQVRVDTGFLRQPDRGLRHPDGVIQPGPG